MGYLDQSWAEPTDSRLVRGSGEVIDEEPGSCCSSGTVLALPEEEGEPVFLLYVTGAVAPPFGSGSFQVTSLEWR